MADFHFLFMSWSFALEWSLQCLLFRLLQRGFIHLLDVWNSWKVLVKNWLWVVIHNNITVEQNKRLLSAWNFPGYCLALSCGVMLRGFSIGFTFNTNLSIFKVKTRERKLFCCRINRSRALFFFSNHGSCYIKNWSTVPNGQQSRTPECLVDLRYLWMLLQQNGGYLLRKCTIFTGKKSPCNSQGMKKHSLLIDFSKFSKIMCHDGFLIMQIMRPEPNYAISHLRLIPEALNKVIWQVDTLLLFCFVAGEVGGGGKTASRKKNVTCKKSQV